MSNVDNNVDSVDNVAGTKFLSCCHGCGQWHMVLSKDDMEHYICPKCGMESYTEDWIKSHPKHKDYQKFLKWKEEHPDG